MKQNPRVLLGWLLLIAGTLLIVWIILSSASVSSQNKPADPCSNDIGAQACIELKQEDGTVFQLNDFRFTKGHCIVFVSLPDRISRNTCGNYQLKWIGPESQNNPTGSLI